MKRTLKLKGLLLGGITVLSLSGLIITIQPTAFAAFDYAPGSSCSLPDGRQGVIQSDKHSCCPLVANNNPTACLFDKYVDPAIGLLSAAVGLVVAIGVVVGAIEFSTSAGDPQRAASGRRHIINALIGLFSYLLLFAFLNFLIPGGLLNVNG